MSDTAVPAMMMELGVTRKDAFGYVAADCNELALPGKAYFNPGAHAAYLPAIETVMNTFFANGGQEMQINAVDTDVLRDAQQHPENHADLVVRVAGFSEFFVHLDPDIQNELIRRTEHES